jgi:hypothetical protein
MKALWNWIGSPAYWRLAAALVSIFMTIAVLGKTGDWLFSASIAFGFYLCWQYGKHYKQSSCAPEKGLP